MYDALVGMLQTIKKTKPLILNITNTVTMDFIANGLLSLGASPIMSNSREEIDELVQLAGAVVINLGTLNDEFIALCEEACISANRLGKPIVFDPVGAGASHYRTTTCLHFLERFKFAIIRGNASEIMALCGDQHTTQGVDSSIDILRVIDPAKEFSFQNDVILVISGKVDAVIDGNEVELFNRGSSLMPTITGTGCLLTAVIGAFQLTHPDSYSAACAAVTFYGVCGELAAMRADGPGSFRMHFIDALAQLPLRDDYETK